MCDISWCRRAEYCRSCLDGIGYVVKFSLRCLEIGFFFITFFENEGLLHYANEVWAQGGDRTSDRLRYCSELGKLA